MSSIQPTPERSVPTIHGHADPDSRVDAHAQEAIAAMNARFMAAFRAGDADRMAACYTPDAQVLPPNHPAVRGQAAIAAFWSATLEQGVGGALLETIEVETRGSLAVELGRYELSGADGAIIDRGKYVVSWHEDGTSWRIHRDIWCSDVPVGA